MRLHGVQKVISDSVQQTVNGNSIGIGYVLDGELDELKIQALRSVNDVHAAAIYTERLRELERVFKRHYIERGMLIFEVEERELWRCVACRPELLDEGEAPRNYHSLAEWIVGEAPHSRSDCFASLKAFKALREVPTEQLLDMPRCNVELLRKMSPSDRVKKVQLGGKKVTVVEAAQQVSENRLRHVINESLPEVHIEPRGPMILKPDLSQKQVIDLGFAAAMWYFEVFSREEALEGVLAAFMAEVCDKEGYAGMQMRAAYQAARERGDAR